MFVNKCRFNGCMTGRPVLKVPEGEGDQSRSSSPAGKAEIKSVSLLTDTAQPWASCTSVSSSVNGAMWELFRGVAQAVCVHLGPGRKPLRRGAVCKDGGRVE